MAKNKTLKVLSTGTVAGMITAAILSSQAFAAVDAYTVKIGEDVLRYDKAALTESFLASKAGEVAPLFEDFTAKLTQAKGFYAFSDAKTGKYVSYDDIQAKFLAAKAAGEAFVVDAYTESTDAKVIEVPTVKKAVVKDGKVSYTTETSDDQTTDLKVQSVTSLNAAQVKVTFDRVLTEDERDEAEDLANYVLENKKGNEIDDVFADVDVKEGSKEVILTVDYDKVGDYDDDLFDNQYSYTLILDENITGQEVSKEFKVSDFDIPEVVSAEVVGIRTIKVKVSEPIVGESIEDAFEINDGDYSIEKIVSINNGKEFNIILFSDLEDGEDVTVDVKSKAVDYAGYSLKKASFDMKAKFNKEDLAVVSYEKAKEREVTLVFNKDIKFADYEDDYELALEDDNVEEDFFDDFYHTTSKNSAYKVKIDGNKLTLYFSAENQLPETAYVYIDADVLVDLWEKENDELITKVNINKDNVKPEIKELEQDDDSNKIIKVTFTEELDEETAEDKDNYVVKDKDGKEVRISSIVLDNDKEKEVTITLSKDLVDGDKYSVTVEDVEDKAGNKISKVTKEFTAVNTSALDVDDITAKYYDEGSSSQKIVVDFDGTKMLVDGSRYAINNLDNYDLQIVGKKTINLSDYDGASIKAVDGGTKVEIKLPGNNADNDDRFNFENETIKLRVNKVEDTNGNRTSISDFETVSAAGGSIEIDGDVKAVDRETIKVVFDDEITLDKGDISLVYVGGTSAIVPSSTKIDKADGKTTVTYTLKEADQLNYDGTYGTGHKAVSLVVKEGAKSENSYGDTLVAATKAVKDKIAVELTKFEDDNTVVTSPFIDKRDDFDDAVKLVSYTKTADLVTADVQLIFEEDIQDAVTKSMFKTDDSDVKVDAAKVNGNVITLTLKITDADTIKDYTDEEDFLGLGITSGSTSIFDIAGNASVVDTEVERINEGVLNVDDAAEEIQALVGDQVTTDVDAATKTITATIKAGEEAKTLTELVTIAAVEEEIGALPEKVTVGGTTFDITNINGIKAAVVELAGADNFDAVTLGDLAGKTIQITYNGVVYTLNVAE